MNKKKVFISIGVFWIMIIGGFIGFKEFTLRTGQEILLKTVPVDPRDLFRGDYVILRYDISTINTDSLGNKGSEFRENDTIYVVLNVDNNKIGTLATINKNKPEGGIFIEGVVKNIYSGTLSVEYGIESYFVPEGTGGEIERNLSKIYTKVAVDSFGNAVIKGLILDGKDIDEK